MTTSLTTLPTRTDASLGVTKVDPGWAVSRLYQLLLAEWNVAADWIVELASMIGTRTAGTWDSLMGIRSGDTFLKGHDLFAANSFATCPGWTSVGTAPTIIADTERGGMTLPLDSAGGSTGIWLGSVCPFLPAQKVYTRMRVTIGGAPGAAHALLGYMDPGVADGWGVRFIAAGTKIQGWVCTAGVYTATDVGVWVAATEYVIEFWISATDGKNYVAINGGTAVACGTPPVHNSALYLFAGAGGAAAQLLRLRTPMIRADWSA